MLSNTKINNLLYDEFFLNRTFNSPHMTSFSKSEISWLAKYLKLDTNAKIIDVACGSGRHLKAFCELGFKPWGIDSSSAGIRLAKENCPATSDPIILDDFLKFADSPNNSYDLVFIAGASFGYDPSAAVNLAHFQNLLKLVSVGGNLVIQYLNKEWARSAFKKPVTFWSEDDLYYILDPRKLDGILLNSDKIFIKKNDLFQKKYSDVITIYSESEILDSIRKIAAEENTHFDKIYLGASFGDTQFDNEKSATPVLILKRTK